METDPHQHNERKNDAGLLEDIPHEISPGLPWNDPRTMDLALLPFHCATPMIGFFYYVPPHPKPMFCPTTRSADHFAAIGSGDFLLDFFNIHRPSTPGSLELIDSCGCFLLFSHPNGNFYSVCNPATKEWKDLPPPPYGLWESPFHVGIISINPSGFEVVRVFPKLRGRSTILGIQIFSSTIWDWSSRSAMCSIGHRNISINGSKQGAFFSDGVIYFLHDETQVLAYRHDIRLFSVIQLPKPIMQRFCTHQGCLGLSAGHLRYAWADTTQLKVWTLIGEYPNIAWEKEPVIIRWPDRMLLAIKDFQLGPPDRVWRQHVYPELELHAHDLCAVTPLGFHCNNPSLVYISVANTVFAFHLDSRGMNLLCGSRTSEWLISQIFLYELQNVPIETSVAKKDDSKSKKYQLKWWRYPYISKRLFFVTG